MKSKIIIILCFCLALFSCAQSKDSAEDIMQRLVNSGVELPDGCLYISNSEAYSQNYLSKEELYGLYYEDNKNQGELELTQSYAIYIAKGRQVQELHIIKTKHRSENDTIRRMLSRRGEILTTPEINPHSSELYIEKPKECKVFSKGSFVFLVAGDDISEILEKIEKIL